MLSLDHCGCMTGAIDAGAERWARLGFTLTPRSRQRGAVPGLDGMQPWATANHCAMLRRGYLELIGLVDPQAYDPWASFTARGEGLHILAMRCDDADLAYAELAARTDCFRAPVQRERPLRVGESMGLARFRNIFSDDSKCPEARYIVIEHQTPDLLWQPHLLDHENGALSLEEAWFVVDDPTGPLAARLGLFGQALADEATGAAFTLEGGGVLRLQSADAFEHVAGYRPPYLPGLHAVTIGVADLDRARALLRTRGVSLRDDVDAIRIPPHETGGFLMRFVQEESR